MLNCYFLQISAIAPKFSERTFSIRYPDDASTYFEMVDQGSGIVNVLTRRTLVEQFNTNRVNVWDVSFTF